MLGTEDREKAVKNQLSVDTRKLHTKESPSWKGHRSQSKGGVGILVLGSLNRGRENIIRLQRSFEGSRESLFLALWGFFHCSGTIYATPLYTAGCFTPALSVSPWFSTSAMVSSENCCFYVFHLRLQARCLLQPSVTICCLFFFPWVSPQLMMPDLSSAELSPCPSYNLYSDSTWSAWQMG